MGETFSVVINTVFYVHFKKLEKYKVNVHKLYVVSNKEQLTIHFNIFLRILFTLCLKYKTFRL